jgi:polysaccharide export outer membrane protein
MLQHRCKLKLKRTFWVFFLISGLFSCTNTRKVIYLNDLTGADSALIRPAQQVFENKIQKNDQLWISVGGSNITDMGSLNSAAGVVAGLGNVGTGSNAMIGYLVESDGSIKIPYAGRIKVEGLTRIELENRLTEIFSAYTKNPVVNVRFLNYFISVLGEVNRPGRVAMYTERATILEAISMSGDITFLGQANNILVIREENGVRTMGRINILSKDLFLSPFYYLRNNDVIYVEPVKSKFISRQGIPQYITIISTSVALILSIVTIISLSNR